MALISVPGEYAVLEAHRALTRDMHVFLFSDHVSVEDEIALKRRGAERGRLVMGPECGTAMLGGVGLGFANVVRRGPVGIVAAAGTGAQEASVLLDGAGSGVSEIIGVGGRDLSAQVGGIMFRAGMELLAADDGTETLLLVSKPPDADAVRALGDVDVARQARGRRLRRLGRRRGAVRRLPHARGRRAARRPRPAPSRDDEPELRRAAASCSACSPAARSPTRPRRSSGPATGSSTSARRSTRRAARTRWSTSSCAAACCATDGAERGLHPARRRARPRRARGSRGRARRDARARSRASGR